jgi:hypothetical protein
MKMERITQKHLEGLVGRLNRLTGSPMSPYAMVDGKHVAQIGNYHLDYAYGGAQLVRIHNLCGGVSTPLMSGHVSNRECYDGIYAFIRGIEAEQARTGS